MWSVRPVPSGNEGLSRIVGNKRETENRKEANNTVELVGVNMTWLLALIIWSAVYGVAVTGCEQQAAGSGGVGVVLGGVVVWLWHRCRCSQCQSTVDGGRGLVQLDLELSENAGSEGSAGEDGTPV